MYAAKAAPAASGSTRPTATDAAMSRTAPDAPPSGVRAPQVRFRPPPLVDARVVARRGRLRGARGPGRRPALLRPPRRGSCASRLWHAAVPVWIVLSAADVTATATPAGPARRRAPAPRAAGRGAGARAPAVRRLDRSDDVPTALAALRARGSARRSTSPRAGPLALLGLRNLPADWIRLDPDLTREIAADPRLAHVVEHTVALARGLGIAVLADGADGPAAAWLTRRGLRGRSPGCPRALTAGQLAERLRRVDDAAVPD